MPAAPGANLKIKNLGITINSAYSEHSPVVSLDETEIVFTSRRLRKDSANIKYKDSRDGQYYEDVYIAYKDDNGQWSDPELINIDRVNHHLASIGLSPDNQTLYVYHDEDGNGNIYQSSLLTDKKWSNPEQVSKEIDSQANEDHLSISVDGSTMFFTSDRKGGLGGTDIYVCRKLPDGKWSKAQNVGAPINTSYNEESPFFHPDGITLHFSSEGHNSMGGFDIFVTELQTDDTWSNPINIGYPINTTHDDITYVTSPDGKRGYFSSYGGDDSSGDMDLYVVLQDDAAEKELTLLKGFINVLDGDTMPQNIAINLSDNKTGKLVAKSRPSQRNGSFVFIIPPGENYNISYEISGKNFYNETIYVPRGSQYQEIENEILLDPIALTAKSIDKETKQDKVAKVQTIGSDIPEETIMDKLSYQEFFTYNTNYPKKEKELQKFIEKLAEQIKTTGSIKISIESSASRVPTKTYNSNDQLSKLRSEIAKKMLLQKLAQIGIEEDKVIFINLTSLVQGPSYKGDYLENKIMYEKYQYVKIYSE